MDINTELKEFSHNIMQVGLETKYSEVELRELIRFDVTTIEGNQDTVISAVAWLDKWQTEIAQHAENFPEEKLARMAQVNMLDPTLLVEEVLCITAECQIDTPLVGVSGRLASKLGFDDHAEAITTAAELIAVICYAGGYELRKDSKFAQWTVIDRLELSDETLAQLDRYMFPLPMVSKPKPLSNNYHSPYLTMNEPVLIGKAEQVHSGEIGLDVINLQNAVALSVNERFLKEVVELPPSVLSEPIDPEKFGAQKERQLQIDLWDTFKRQSEIVYKELVTTGNRFFLTWRVDQRLRVYSKGYHINPQGRPYKKAMLDLADKEVCTGTEVLDGWLI